MRYTRYSKYFTHLHLLIDILITIFLCFYFIQNQYNEVGQYLSIKQIFLAHYKVIILFSFSWFFISEYTDLYKISRQNSLSFILKRDFSQIVLFSIIVFAISGFKTEDLFSNKRAIYYLAVLFILTFLSRLIIYLLVRLYRHFGGNFRRIVFIDENNNTHQVINLLNRRKDYGYTNLGYFLSEIDKDISTKQYNFDFTELRYFLLENKIQIMFFSLNGKLSQDVQDDLIFLAQKLHIEIRFIPSAVYDSFSSLKLEYYDTFPILTFKEFPLDNFWNRFLKRTFDIVFSLFIVVFILSWLYPIIALAILIDSGRPIIYLQKRIGLKGKPFNCYKFRTMKASKDNDVKATVRGDKRITKLGNLLRKTSLDELPQFINVLKGNMSVVGPRPHMVVQDEYYNDLFLKYSLRHYVKPGITGLAQVKGFRGEINSKEDMLKRVTADVFYVKNWSFLLDLGIITGTFFKVLWGDRKAF